MPSGTQTQGLVNVQIKHHPTSWDIISNKYLKVMFKIPQKGHLLTPETWQRKIPWEFVLDSGKIVCRWRILSCHTSLNKLTNSFCQLGVGTTWNHKLSEICKSHPLLGGNSFFGAQAYAKIVWQSPIFSQWNSKTICGYPGYGFRPTASLLLRSHSECSQIPCLFRGWSPFFNSRMFMAFGLDPCGENPMFEAWSGLSEVGCPKSHSLSLFPPCHIQYSQVQPLFWLVTSQIHWLDQISINILPQTKVGIIRCYIKYPCKLCYPPKKNRTCLSHHFLPWFHGHRLFPHLLVCRELLQVRHAAIQELQLLRDVHWAVWTKRWLTYKVVPPQS